MPLSEARPSGGRSSVGRVLTIVSPGPPTRRIVLAHRRGERLTPAGAAMGKILMETGRAWKPAQP